MRSKQNLCNLLSSNTKKIAKHSPFFRHFFILQGWFGTKFDNAGGFFNHKDTLKNPLKSAFPERISVIRVPVFFCLFNHKGTKKKSSFIIFPIKNPSGTIVPKGLKYFFSVKLCVFSVKHCVIKTLKNLLRSAFPKGISRIRVPIFFGFLSSIHYT